MLCRPLPPGIRLESHSTYQVSRLRLPLASPTIWGFGIGWFAPVLFGRVMDLSQSWAMAYLVLAAGGVIAGIAAVTLRLRN